MPLAFISFHLTGARDHARSLRSPLRGVCHLPLLGAGFCASLVAAPLFSSRVRFWALPPIAGERQRSQTLNFLGGNKNHG